MSPMIALLVGAGLIMQATSLRTAPKPVITPEQFVEAAESLKGLTNGTLCLYARKAAKSSAKSSNPHIIGDGTPLPLEKMNWEVEDFNPEALERGPCGIKEEIPDRVGEGAGLTTPQEKLVVALKLWLTELQKNTDGDNAKACEKMDKSPADKKVDEAEFDAWIESQPFDARVKTEHGEVMDAMWQIMKQRGEDFMTLDGCKDDLKKLTDKFNKPPAL
eukprot:gnl/MRDRNA2_/MRDRNA2_59769_c0_seq1.p1 gnl/MRDRNA2_/MRDRNA2_59769_c0~~gnl/MRDRNA2_/MRDRNA2_59769_c0_seq1.p1  ORF type:complete len:243 (-),score=83.89 gnl/MRDRNA2_/MRDRNA2_59769_c0_seq1:45-698(-)